MAASTKPKPMILQGSKGYPVQEICLHVSATRSDWQPTWTSIQRFNEIRRWHMEDNKWKDIGYHWVIDRDGTLLQGRKENVIGAGVAGHNAGVIHIMALGGHGGSADGKIEDTWSKHQIQTLKLKIVDIGKRTQIKRISGHNEFAAKACPCFRVPKWVQSCGGLAPLLAGKG
jgi:hypothetical protein